LVLAGGIGLDATIENPGPPSTALDSATRRCCPADLASQPVIRLRGKPIRRSCVSIAPAGSSRRRPGEAQIFMRGQVALQRIVMTRYAVALKTEPSARVYSAQRTIPDSNGKSPRHQQAGLAGAVGPVTCRHRPASSVNDSRE
jgi:hypothetical protein